MKTQHYFLLLLSIVTLTRAATAAEGYTDTPMQPNGKWHVHDPNRPQPKVVTPGVTFSHLAPAPSDAVVLFDGKDFSKWRGEKGDVQWKLENDYMETTHTGRIHTKDEFGDFQLHLEFATPSEVKGKGQGRGNNGVNIYGRYEIQVLDSYNNPTYADGQAAAIYAQTPPLFNASKPPGEWQTYDIIWETPRWDNDNKLVKKAYVTVLHNGVVVHHRQELCGYTNHREVGNYDHPHPPKGFIELYEHGNPVRFRNIWIRPLGEYDQP
jgi:3-keto-disaccharide hydrolase